MSASTTYECRACGASVSPQARSCRFCSVPVATVRCASCFHMSVPDAAFCGACGLELGLEPLGEGAHLACPVCKLALTAFRHPNGSLFDCGHCGGQFVEHALFRDMLARHAHPEGLARPDRPPAVADPRTHYIPCPVCASLMNRKNFAGSSGVIVDVCKSHGTFFDLGELPRVLAFVESGGLNRASHAAAEEEAAKSRRARIEAASAPSLRSLDVPSGSHGLAERLLHLLLG